MEFRGGKPAEDFVCRRTSCHDGRCRVTTRRRADDALVEMMPVGIAASTALAAIRAIGDIFRIRARDRLDRLRERILAARFRAHCSADREKGLPRSSREPLRIGRLVE